MNSTHPSYRDWIYLVLFIGLGLWIRLDLAAPYNYIIDSDEAIVGLMGKHILEGKPIPTFYYGQHYMGSLEAILASFSFAIFGISNFALKLVPLFFSLLLIPLIYLIGKEVGTRRGALIAALLMAIPPAPLVVWSAKARGGFVEIIVIGACALLAALRWERLGRTVMNTLLCAILLGIGWWVNNQIIYFMLPVALLMSLSILSESFLSIGNRVVLLIKHGFVGILGFLLGGLPFWIYNLEHDFASFGMFTRSTKKEIVQHIDGLFSTALPILLGAKRFWHAEEVFPGATLLTLGLVGVLLISLLLIRNRPTYPRLHQEKSGTGLWVISCFILVCLSIFVISSFGYLVQAPRYLLPIYLGLFILEGEAIVRWSRGNRAVAGAMCIALLSLHLASSYSQGRSVPGEPFVYGRDRVSRDHSQLIKWLKDTNTNLVRTNYWIGYRLAFETKEQVRFKVFGEPHHARLDDYEEAVEKARPESVPLILVPSQTKIVKEALRTLQLQYQEIKLSGYNVIFQVKEPVENPVELHPTDVRFETNWNLAAAHGLYDGNNRTRWGSGAPQSPGMTFTIHFDHPQVLRGISYDLGLWPHDFPRGLALSGTLPNGEIKELLTDKQYDAVRYYFSENSSFHLFFPTTTLSALTLRQTRSDRIFDWTIAELKLLK